MKEIYVFLDWTMTISGLITNNAINNKMFEKFLGVLKKLENAFNGKVKLCIVSGTTKTSASKRNNIIKNAFAGAKRLDIYQGFAYEYGGYFVDFCGKHHVVKNLPLNANVKNKIIGLSKKHGLNAEANYNLCLSFNGENTSKQNFNNFYNECLKLNEVSLVYYDDPEGYGCDIKNPKLNKGVFVKWFLKNSCPNMIIVGGDDNEDLKMIVNHLKAKTYFVGFNNGNYNEQINAKSFLSDKRNVEGIIDNLENLIISYK